MAPLAAMAAINTAAAAEVHLSLSLRAAIESFRRPASA
jgi:hypothetical protein